MKALPAGLLVVALLLYRPLQRSHGAARSLRFARPNVVLITIDTLRADHLHCYGYTQVQTPVIDALARESARFAEAFTPVPLTLPAHTALMTGSYPMATGMHDFIRNSRIMQG